jgi:hypothetical protein
MSNPDESVETREQTATVRKKRLAFDNTEQQYIRVQVSKRLDCCKSGYLRRPGLVLKICHHSRSDDAE